MKGPRALYEVAKGHGGRLVAGRDKQDEKGSVSGTLSGRAVVAAGIQGAGDREALMLLPPPRTGGEQKRIRANWERYRLRRKSLATTSSRRSHWISSYGQALRILGDVALELDFSATLVGSSFCALAAALATMVPNGSPPNIQL